MNTASNCFSTSQTLRRLSLEYRRWAIEDEAAQNWQRSRYHYAEAFSLWQRAKSYLRHARINRRTPA